MKVENLKKEIPSQRELLEFYKEALSRTSDAMIDLARNLDVGGMRPLDEEEKMLLRAAVVGMLKNGLKEVIYFTMAGSLKEAVDTLQDWAIRLENLG